MGGVSRIYRHSSPFLEFRDLAKPERRLLPLHRHLALELQDGVRLVSDEIKIGAGGHRYVFVHPSSAGGVLLELVEGH